MIANVSIKWFDGVSEDKKLAVCADVIREIKHYNFDDNRERNHAIKRLMYKMAYNRGLADIIIDEQTIYDKRDNV